MKNDTKRTLTKRYVNLMEKDSVTKRNLTNEAHEKESSSDSSGFLSAGYQNDFMNTALLNESCQSYPNIKIIEQCFIKTNGLISRILVYGPENK